VTFRSADLVEVHAWGHLVGAVALDERTGFFAFEYAPDWIAGGVELAPFHMPNQPGPFVFPQLADATFHRLPALLADCLPDRFGNALITARLTAEGVGVAEISPLDRLAYLADRAMGALEFRPPIGVPASDLTAIQLADLVVAARRAMRGDFTTEEHASDALRQLIQVGTSAGGARAKAVICFNPATSQVRSGHVPAPVGFEHWLVKLDGVDQSSAGVEVLGGWQGFTRVEYAYHRMATAAGIEMTQCRLLAEGDRAHFLTRRFDRAPHGVKVHTQTLCALAHLDFNLATVHDYSQYLAAIDDLGLGPDALGQAFRRIVFNVAAVNRDDHTKNVSFLCDDRGRWSLAPAYDVTFAHNPSGRWTSRHQMSVNGKFDGISRDDLFALADRFAVPSVRAAFADVLAAVERWPEFAADAAVDTRAVDMIGDAHRTYRPS
jgi:serine/threonine-protein kinase HipA